MLRDDVQHTASLAHTLSVSSTIFEPYIESLTAHYVTQAATNLSAIDSGQMSPTGYVEWAMAKESEEVERYFMGPTNIKVSMAVSTAVLQEVGTKVQDRIIRRGQ